MRPIGAPTNLQIAIAVPDRPGTTSGNSVTGSRWSRRLEELGHLPRIVPVIEGDPLSSQEIPAECDVVIALHAKRCASAVMSAVAQNANRPVVVALAGTDLYRDLPDAEDAMTSLRLADHIVVLQEQGLEQLAAIGSEFRAKASVVHQSVEPSALVRNVNSTRFTVVVLAHLREVKDPLLAAKAARLLPRSSVVRVEHAGAAHDDHWRAAAEQEMEENERYIWHGPLDQAAAAQLLSRADALACTSVLEGGANAVSEAIALGIPVIGTDIGGNRGLVGADHPGLVPVGDYQALARLSRRLEEDPTQTDDLQTRSESRQWMTTPAHERTQWATILDRLSPSNPPHPKFRH